MEALKTPPFYKRVASRVVPGFVVEKIDGETVEPSQTPYQLGYKEVFSRLVTCEGLGEVSDPMVQVSPAHNRVFEIRYGQKGNVFWADEFGNPYFVLQEKGDNVANPTAYAEERAPSGFTYWGLQDSDSILRTVRASSVLRARRMGTEAVVRLTEPTELIYEDKRVPVSVYKQKLIDKIWEANYINEKKQEHGRRPITRSDIPGFLTELQDVVFYISTLGRQVSERFNDLRFVASKEDLIAVLENAFTFWNFKQEFLMPEGQKDFLDIYNPKDVLRYFTQILPAETAKNYATLHGKNDPKEKLLHTHPHLGNVSLAGTIYDLDSVRGEALGIGDAKVEEKDVQKELQHLLKGKEGWELSEGIFWILNQLEEKNFYFEGVEFDDIAEKFGKAFALKYIEERGWLEDFEENIHNIDYTFRLCQVFFGEQDKDLRDYLIQKVGDQKTDALFRTREFNAYPFPIMFNIYRRSFGHSGPDEYARDYHKESTRPTEDDIRGLLRMHQISLLKLTRPAEALGQDFFSFDSYEEGYSTLHENLLSQEDVDQIVKLHILGELEGYAKGYSPRTLGSFILALAQINTKQLMEAAQKNMPGADDPQLVEKMVRMNEFLELIPPRGTHKNKEVRTYFDQILKSQGDYRAGANLEREVDYKTAIALFSRGIVTPFFRQIFNHTLMDIILNEFTPKQANALKQAILCPDFIDPLIGGAHTRYLLQVALTCAQVQSGQFSELGLVGEMGSKPNEAAISDLQYLLASVDKDQINDKKLKRALAKDPDKKRNLTDESFTMRNVVRLIRAGKPLHPNSYLAEQIKKTALYVDDLIVISKVALDITEGDLTRLDPVIRQILENKKGYAAMVKNINMAELIYASIAFGVDIPKLADNGIKAMRGMHPFLVSDFLTYGNIRKATGVYNYTEAYPVSPIYKLMSEGFAALPAKIRETLTGEKATQEVIDEMVKGLLHNLFSEDHLVDGYFRNFFGGIGRSEGYPSETEAGFNNYKKFEKSNGKLGWELWNIVHLDIWNYIRRASEGVLVDYIDQKVQSRVVKVGITHPQNGMGGWRNTDLLEVLPPDLYAKIAHLT